MAQVVYVMHTKKIKNDDLRNHLENILNENLIIIEQKFLISYQGLIALKEKLDKLTDLKEKIPLEQKFDELSQTHIKLKHARSAILTNLVTYSPASKKKPELIMKFKSQLLNQKMEEMSAFLDSARVYNENHRYTEAVNILKEALDYIEDFEFSAKEEPYFASNVQNLNIKNFYRRTIQADKQHISYYSPILQKAEEVYEKYVKFLELYGGTHTLVQDIEEDMKLQARSKVESNYKELKISFEKKCVELQKLGFDTTGLKDEMQKFYAQVEDFLKTVK
jgi:hypothetical protein